jgi:excisionase family DNA binding protein
MDGAQATLPEYLSLGQSSALSGFSTRTLRRAIAAGELEAHHVKRRVRIRRTELKRWIESDGAPPPASTGGPVHRPSSR